MESRGKVNVFKVEVQMSCWVLCVAVNKDLTAVELTLTSLLVAHQTYNNLPTSLAAQVTPSLERPLVTDIHLYIQITPHRHVFNLLCPRPLQATLI